MKPELVQSDKGLPCENELHRLASEAPLDILLAEAARLRDRGHGPLVSYSRKVFVPLTRLCRDVCGYCTFAHPPRKGEAAYLSRDEVLAIARAGARAGCKEALFTLGDKPEMRYRAAREALDGLGHETTISYLAELCELVHRETGLLAHSNPGVVSGEELRALRRVSVSQGLMLESASERLCAPGGPHYGSPDKLPAARLATIAEAGRLRIPFTTGILIGIGETRAERIDSLLAIRALHLEFGHIQEVIVQTFRAKAGTRMASASEPDLDELIWTIAVARIAFGPDMNIQAPPNLSPDACPRLIAAGINDWGGVSPVTPDHVNPEAPWPEVEVLARRTAEAGKQLIERLAVYPAYARDAAGWQAPEMAAAVLRASDALGLARTDDWSPGLDAPVPQIVAGPAPRDRAIAGLIDRATGGAALGAGEIATLFGARGADFQAVAEAADDRRRAAVGDVVTYVVNRNINYTNICAYACRFCAFSKGRRNGPAGDAPYVLDLDEIGRRAGEAWDRGATEVCMQGGIHPSFTGETYLSICRAVRAAAPEIHIHAFSPLEVVHGAQTMGWSTGRFLERLKEAGLGSLPGTAAEILDDEVRAALCPDKITTGQWLSVMEEAHVVGLPSTATIMFGHVDTPESWARHLAAIRDLQARSRGFTEFVPLPFVHMEAPIYLKGRARRGPTFREAVLMHAVSRLVLGPLIPNIQTSWVKMGPAGIRACLDAGANDLGGTLMNESITRAAGTVHGQEFPAWAMEDLISRSGRRPRRRTTLYGEVPMARRQSAFEAPAATWDAGSPADVAGAGRGTSAAARHGAAR